MGFTRAVLPISAPIGEELNGDMIGIGMLFEGFGAKSPNIENTLLFASRLGVDGHDFRVLAVLCTWMGVHARGVNADRLTSLVKAERTVHAAAGVLGRHRSLASKGPTFRATHDPA